MKKTERLKRDTIKETLYTCKYCGKTFDKEMIIEHTMSCIANYNERKSCLTCNKYKIKRFSTTEVVEQGKYLDETIMRVLGGTNCKIFCPEKDKIMSEKEINEELECWEAPKDDIEYIDTQGYLEELATLYEEYIDKPESFKDEEAYKNAKEFIKKHKK
jgi:hypothetical protein